MNDPGLDGPVHHSANDVEENDAGKAEEEEEHDYLEPSRWWFASTAFPLIAGTFGPMASAFNLCALIGHWTEIVPPNGVLDQASSVPDPKWLIGVNAVSLVLAVFANFALLMNMARRLPFALAQTITIVGWYLASIILIGLLAAAEADLKLQSPPNHAHAQAFYYAIIAAALYFLVASLMVATVFGAYTGYVSREFSLTLSQRSLMLQTISFMVYLLSGAAVFAHVEDWIYLDGVYWADFTLLTVGIGDFAPATHLGRGLLFPYAIGGVLILGLVIGSIRSLILEKGKRKMGARMIEKHRRRALRQMSQGKGNSSSNTSREPVNFLADGLEEKEKRRREFNLMRQVQAKGSKRRKWMALLTSTTAAGILWFIGAVVFWKSEQNHGWSYFQALYFAYTSLLTIGYGDYYPESNAGKPFLVFWSLLAVPTLTILISNMGDTIVKSIADITLWVGSFTVLPGEGGFSAAIKTTAAQATRGKLFSGTHHMDEPPGFIAEKEDSPKQTMHTGDVENLAGEIEEEELSDAEAAGNIGDKMAQDRHFYHYLLVREIVNVMKHVNSSPPREYTYDEWAWFLKLLGEDEASPDRHSRPSEKGELHPDGEGHEQDLRHAEEADGGGVVSQWSWLDHKSPLMGTKEEAEWVLERLALTLEEELREQREEKIRRDKGEDPRRPRATGAESSGYSTGDISISSGSAKLGSFSASKRGLKPKNAKKSARS
ncbi:MAG: hypothetical protein M1819_001369 [Sarea resinae]|nr:MAG: hypothetical protein M1819_001369 [Sarea resinae]